MKARNLYHLLEDYAHTQKPEKTFRPGRFFKRCLITLGVCVVSIFGISLLLVAVYEDDVKSLIIKELNKHLNAEVRIDPRNIDLTVIRSFPDCALEFKNLTVMEVTTSKTPDTLLYAGRLALAFNLIDLFNNDYTIKNIALEDAHANLLVNKEGQENYQVWKTDTLVKSNDSLSFALEKIQLKRVVISYKNSQQKIKVETAIEQLSFKGKFNHDRYLLQSDGRAFVTLFQVGKVNYLQDKNLRFDVDLDVNGNTYTIKKSQTSVNATQLVSQGAFVIQDSLISLDVNFKGDKLDISSTLSLLPETYQAQIHDYTSDGEFYAQGEFHYKSGKPLTVSSKFGIRQASIIYKPNQATLSQVNLTGSIDVTGKRSVLKLENINARLNNNRFNGEVEISHFEDPYLKLKFAAKTKLEDLMSFYPIDTIQELSGSIDIDASIEGMISELKTNPKGSSIISSGGAKLSHLKAKFKHSDKEVNIPEGEFRLNNSHLNVSHLKLIKGNSDVMLVGEVSNFLGYVFDANAPLVINAFVTSERIDLEDFIFATGKSGSSASSSVSISDKIDFNVNVNIAYFSFSKFTADHIKGNLLLKDKKVAVKDLSLNATDGTITLNAVADASGQHIKVSGDVDLQQLNIQKLFSELNNFGQNTLQDKHLRGYMTSHVDFSAVWDRQLNVDLNSIQATSQVLIERGELIGFQPLESLGKFIEVNELRHIKFSTLQTAIEIKNRSITIPRTSIKSTAINLELWGTHHFDNVIDYRIQLLISELLSKKSRANKGFDDELSLVEKDPENRRSVFIRMTGPMDHPSITYDRKGAKEKIKQDIQLEKQNMKQILKEEFGFFKKDTSTVKKEPKADQKFQIQVGDEEPKKSGHGLTPKKKEEDDDF